MRNDQAELGFSLAEMLVVLTLVSLIGLVGFNGFKGSRNTDSVRTITQKIQYIAAQTSLRAVSTGDTESLVIDVQEKLISSRANTAVVTLPDAFKLSVLTGMELIRQDGVASINFYNDGTSSGGEITVEDGNGSKQTVRILWLTGAIELKGGE
jgi:general secretion pathway protein H